MLVHYFVSQPLFRPLQMYYQVGLPRKDNFAVDYALLDLVEQMAYEPFYDQLR
jgi:hypothetical protein